MEKDVKDISVIKPDMAVVGQDRLGLSPFGMLSQVFHQEVVRRSQLHLGFYQPVPLALLEEEQGEEAAAAKPAELHLQFEVNVKVEAPKEKAKGKKEAQEKPAPAAPEQRILERVRLLQKELRESRETTRRVILQSDAYRKEARLPGEARAAKGAAPGRGAPVAPRSSAALAAKELPLAVAATAAPSGGGWTPRWQQAHPGYPAQKEAGQLESTPAGSILLPDALRRRRQEILGRQERGLPPLPELTAALEWAAEGSAEAGVPAQEKLARMAEEAVCRTLAKDRARRTEPQAPREPSGSAALHGPAPQEDARQEAWQQAQRTRPGRREDEGAAELSAPRQARAKEPRLGAQRPAAAAGEPAPAAGQPRLRMEEEAQTAKFGRRTEQEGSPQKTRAPEARQESGLSGETQGRAGSDRQQAVRQETSMAGQAGLPAEALQKEDGREAPAVALPAEGEGQPVLGELPLAYREEEETGEQSEGPAQKSRAQSLAAEQKTEPPAQRAEADRAGQPAWQTAGPERPAGPKDEAEERLAGQARTAAPAQGVPVGKSAEGEVPPAALATTGARAEAVEGGAQSAQPAIARPAEEQHAPAAGEEPLTYRAERTPGEAQATPPAAPTRPAAAAEKQSPAAQGTAPSSTKEKPMAAERTPHSAQQQAAQEKTAGAMTPAQQAQAPAADTPAAKAAGTPARRTAAEERTEPAGGTPAVFQDGFNLPAVARPAEGQHAPSAGEVPLTYRAEPTPGEAQATPPAAPARPAAAAEQQSPAVQGTAPSSTKEKPLAAERTPHSAQQQAAQEKNAGTTTPAQQAQAPAPADTPEAQAAGTPARRTAAEERTEPAGDSPAVFQDGFDSPAVARPAEGQRAPAAVEVPLTYRAEPAPGEAQATPAHPAAAAEKQSPAVQNAAPSYTKEKPLAAERAPHSTQQQAAQEKDAGAVAPAADTPAAQAAGTPAEERTEPAGAIPAVFQDGFDSPAVARPAEGQHAPAAGEVPLAYRAEPAPGEAQAAPAHPAAAAEQQSPAAQGAAPSSTKEKPLAAERTTHGAQQQAAQEKAAGAIAPAQQAQASAAEKGQSHAEEKEPAAVARPAEEAGAVRREELPLTHREDPAGPEGARAAAKETGRAAREEHRPPSPQKERPARRAPAERAEEAREGAQPKDRALAAGLPAEGGERWEALDLTPRAEHGQAGPDESAGAARGAEESVLYQGAAERPAVAIPRREQSGAPQEGAELAYRSAPDAQDAPAYRDIRIGRPRQGAAPRREPATTAIPAEGKRWSGPAELTFARPPWERQAQEEPKAPAGQKPQQSEYLNSLPRWAQELLNKPSGPAKPGGPAQSWTAGGQSGSPAGQKGPAAQPGGTVEWTAPGALPAGSSVTTRPVDMKFRQKAAGEENAAGAKAPAMSEAEVQKTAEKVYRIIEERLRRELRRSGK